MSDAKKPPMKRPEIIDPHVVPIVFVDWFVTGGIYNEVVNIALGSIDHSRKEAGAELAKVVVATRLRMSREFAKSLHATLGSILGLTPASPNESPPQASSPPRNMVN